MDYTDSSSPCPSSASLKLVLAVANIRELPLNNIDVVHAYIWASRNEEVSIKFPGSCGEKSKKNAKLEKAIYGLKQSGCKWGHLCADTLIADGFEQCKADPYIFRNIVDWVVIMVISIYVDDLLVEGSQEDCESLLLSLNRTFPTNDLGECTHLVRWVWHREERRFRYDQVVARSIRRELYDTL